MNVYETCPVFAGDRMVLRPVQMADAAALLRVYSDEKAWPYFNADNCTSDFRYRTLQQMQDCLAMWLWSYEQGHFVRWSICLDERPIGTVELFRRPSQDAFDGAAVLRIDLGSAFETEEILHEVLTLLLPHALPLFGSNRMITKAPPFASERMLALARMGFVPADEPLIGGNGQRYGDYWLLTGQAD